MTLFNACAQFYGKEEDCKELVALRKLFDDIKGTKAGKVFLKSYESVAPDLVQKINSSEVKQKIYDYIWLTMDNCAVFISHGEEERCIYDLKFLLKYLKKVL